MAKLVRKSYHEYAGKVIDLHIANSHTYNVEGISVHNSGGGSLVNYLLGITQVDPLKYDLLWERFLGRHRCVDPSTYVIAESGKKMIKDLVEGERVLTHTGEFKAVIDKDEAVHDMAVRVKFAGQEIICSPNHRWVINRSGKQIEVMACHLQKGDKLIKYSNGKCL